MEVAADDLLDRAGWELTLAEAADDAFETARVIQLGNEQRAHFVRSGDAAFRATVDERLVLAQILRRLFDRCGAEIAADADMIDAADLDGVLDLPHQHLHRRRAGAGADERHEVDADHAALVGHRLELAILFAARMAIDLAA